MKTLVPACVAVLLLLFAVPASAAGVGYLRLAHLSPDTPQVDVYVTPAADPSGTIVVKGVGYGAVSDYRAVPAGDYTVAMRASGAAADSPPVLSLTATIAEGRAYTVAGTGKYANLGLKVLDDDLTPPPAGQSRIRIIDAAATAPSLDVTFGDGRPLAGSVGFAANTPYTTVAAGSWTLKVSAPGGPTASVPCELAANGVYTMVLLDRNGTFAGQMHQDAAGSSVVPVGGVETGMGGTAAPGLPFVLAAGVLLLVGGSAGLVARRRAG
jgi:hypothetical protein